MISELQETSDQLNYEVIITWT